MALLRQHGSAGGGGGGDGPVGGDGGDGGSPGGSCHSYVSSDFLLHFSHFFSFLLQFLSTWHTLVAVLRQHSDCKAR